MGMMLFLMASGLTLIFGLMDVLNFAHGGFVTLGAFLAVTVLGQASGWVASAALAAQPARPRRRRRRRRRSPAASAAGPSSA